MLLLSVDDGAVLDAKSLAHEADAEPSWLVTQYSFYSATSFRFSVVVYCFITQFPFVVSPSIAQMLGTPPSLLSDFPNLCVKRSKIAHYC